MKNSVEFELAKQEEINKLEKQNEFLEKLKDGNTKTNVLSQEQLQEIEIISSKNNVYLKKLKSNEFEIAIVGLEKAGKSTFANALIDSSILPSAPERCTFTSTRLVSGTDKAIVEFYTESEFDDIFQQLLKEVEYPEYDKASYKTLSLDEFSNFFSSLEGTHPHLYKNHLGKTDKEIEDILKSKNKLILDGSSKEFSGSELTEDIFQAYIKGENSGDDTSKPRSVKRIEIESSNLKQLESAVIYDVPGFDSPTKIHERQTIERLKNADAIILVTNVGRNPSLTGTQLNIITNNADDDGISLRDKLFVFGNQLDTANNLNESEKNTGTLIKDVEKYKIGEKKRVFVGSAKKYLVDQEIDLGEFSTSFEIQAGIQDIRAELINYYENERFEILKRRIDTNKRALKNIFISVLKDADIDIDPDFEEHEKIRINIESSKQITFNLKDNLEKLKGTLKNEIWTEKYFSNKFRDDIDTSNYFNEIDIDYIQKIKLTVDDSLTLDTPIQKINQSIRQSIHKRFLVEFSDLILSMTDQKSDDVQLRILRTFTTSIVGSENSQLFDEVEKESEDIIHKLTSDIGHNSGRFSYLIERFSRDIFDILISYPLFSHDRKNKFIEAEKEFYSLDSHYAGTGSLINMALTGEGQKLTFGLNTLLNQMKKIQRALKSPNPLDKIKVIVESLDSLMDTTSSSQGMSCNINELLKDKITSETEEQVLDEINHDIKNLKDILKVAVMSAINMELVYLNSVDKQIKILVDAVQSPATIDSNAKVFNTFMSKIVSKINAKELSNINAKIEGYKLQKAFLQEMKEFEF
ncbi:MAG: hypothetical protein COA47_13615 [Robiginitomaculum sp.]|nr:MAG: hypothetical protein COA47_13615 [Robiginitomaculum sp.]